MKEFINWVSENSLGIFIALSTLYFSWQNNKRANQEMTKNLFTEFNLRYDKLNSILHSTVSKKLSELTQEEENTIDDYCNLCAEQFYWKKAGRIDKKIWKAWHAGMKEWYKNHEAFRNYWDKEVNKNKISYYMEEKDENFLKN